MTAIASVIAILMDCFIFKTVISVEIRSNGLVDSFDVGKSGFRRVWLVFNPSRHLHEDLKDTFELVFDCLDSAWLGRSGYRFLLWERWKLCNSLVIELDRSFLIEDFDRFPLNI